MLQGTSGISLLPQHQSCLAKESEQTLSLRPDVERQIRIISLLPRFQQEAQSGQHPALSALITLLQDCQANRDCFVSIGGLEAVLDSCTSEVCPICVALKLGIWQQPSTDPYEGAQQRLSDGLSLLPVQLLARA